jgi:hypothetical protein
VKVGLIARAEDRGLGVMTWAFHRNMRPAKTLVIAPLPEMQRGFTQHHERYEGAGVFRAAWGGGELDEKLVRDFLDGLDVVYSAETFYDPRLPEWAREQGVATVLHAMPEFFNPALPQATMTWLPTSWRADTIPSAPVVAVPIEEARPALPPNPDLPLRILHVVGHRAMADRNGTLTVLQALRIVKARMHVTIVCQDARLPSVRVASNVRVTRTLGGEKSLEPRFATNDVILIPRRYGGLCLPAQEALSFGRALVMPDVSPNADWPILPLPARFAADSTIRTVAGEIPAAIVEPRDVARLLDELAADPARVWEQSVRAYEWAQRHTWARMKPVYDAQLAEACLRVTA